MEDPKAIWNQYTNILNNNLIVNKHAMIGTNLAKAKYSLRKLMAFRIAECMIFGILVFLLGLFIAINIVDFPLAIPAMILNVFAIIGMSGSIKQMVLISRIDYSEAITSIQKNLETIKSHRLQNIKLILLSIPFYMAYIVLGFNLLFDVNVFADADTGWLISNYILSIALVPPVIWLYRKLNFKNIGTSWVRTLIESSGGEQLTTAMGFLNEIETFEKEG